MADNTTLPGTGDVIATDDIGGIKHQKIKIEFGASDSATQVEAANPLPVSEPAVSTATTTSVADVATSTQLLASTATRRGVTITNTSSATLYVKLGTAATTTSFVARLPQFWTWEMPQPIYTGVIHGIWATDPGDGVAVITEV